MHHHHTGYGTEEDEEIAREVLAGRIDIADGEEVLVEHRQPPDSIEGAFWSRACTTFSRRTGFEYCNRTHTPSVVNT